MNNNKITPKKKRIIYVMSCILNIGIIYVNTRKILAELLNLLIIIIKL